MNSKELHKRAIESRKKAGKYYVPLSKEEGKLVAVTLKEFLAMDLSGADKKS